MKPQTYDTLKCILKMDGEIEQPRIAYALEVLAGRVDIPDKPVTAGVLRIPEVAKLLGIKSPTVHKYAQLGWLERVYPSGGERAVGISRESVERFVARGVQRV